MTHALDEGGHMQPDDEVELELDDTIQSSEGACATETHATTATITRLMADAAVLRTNLDASKGHNADLMAEVSSLQAALRLAKMDKDAERTSFESTFQLAFLEHAVVTLFEASVTRTAIHQLGAGKLNASIVEKHEYELWLSILQALTKPDYSRAHVLDGKSERTKARSNIEYYSGIHLADYLVDLALLSFPIDPPIHANQLMYTILAWRAFTLLEHAEVLATSSIAKTAGRDIRQMYEPVKELAHKYYIRGEVLEGTASTVSRLLSNVAGEYLGETSKAEASIQYTARAHTDEDACRHVALALLDAGNGEGGTLYSLHACSILAFIVARSRSVQAVFNLPPAVELTNWARTHHAVDKFRVVVHTTEHFVFHIDLGDVPYTTKSYQLCLETAIRKAIYFATCVNLIRSRQYRIDNLYEGVGAFGLFGTGLKLPSNKEERKELLQHISAGLTELTIIQQEHALGSSDPAREMDLELIYNH